MPNDDKPSRMKQPMSSKKLSGMIPSSDGLSYPDAKSPGFSRDLLSSTIISPGAFRYISHGSITW